MSPTVYFRVLALASLDIILTLPFGIVNIVLTIVSAPSSPFGLTFYPGWTNVHANWDPVGFSYADYGEHVSTTEEAAKDVASFLSLWFEAFPQFEGRTLHLSGESYGV